MGGREPFAFAVDPSPFRTDHHRRRIVLPQIDGGQERLCAGPFIEPDTVGGWIVQGVGETDGILDIGGAQPARLFARLARNALPALHAFVCAGRQTLLAPVRLNRHDPGDAELCRLFHRPFEPLEFDQRQVQCYAGKFGAGRDLFDHAEPDQVLASSFNRSQPGAFIVGDFELLARLDTEHPRQVMSVLACDFSLTFANVIDEEAAACHVPCLIHLWRAAIEDGRLVNMTTRSVRIILALRIEIENWETRMKPLCIARLSLFLALAGTAASSLPAQTPVTEAEDGYHFKYWEGSFHNLAYTEWWYFNLYDPGTDTQAIFSYQVLDPSNLAKLGAGALGAVVYQGNNIVPEYDFYPLKSFTASYSAANVTLGSNMISVVGANTYYVTGASRDGRLSWNLFYQREDTSWFAGTHVNVGSAPWEQMSWLLYMPLAKVTGTLTVDGQTSAIDTFGYHDHNWGQWNFAGDNWNWAQYSQSGLAFDLGDFPGNPVGRARIEIAGKEVVFSASEYTFTHTKWAFDKQHNLFYPVQSIFTGENGDLKAVILMDVQKTEPLSTGPPPAAVIYEQPTHFTGSVTLQGQSASSPISFEGDGFKEYTATTSATQ